MRALCPDCGEHHDVVRILDQEGQGEAQKDVYQVAALGGCDRTWLTDADLLEARARFDQEAIIAEEDDIE
jgi:hypothetical protein